MDLRKNFPFLRVTFTGERNFKRGGGGKVGHSAFPLADFAQAAIERRMLSRYACPCENSRIRVCYSSRRGGSLLFRDRRRHARSPRLLQKPTFSRHRRFLGGAAVSRLTLSSSLREIFQCFARQEIFLLSRGDCFSSCFLFLDRFLRCFFFNKKFGKIIGSALVLG